MPPQGLALDSDHMASRDKQVKDVMLINMGADNYCFEHRLQVRKAL